MAMITDRFSHAPFSHYGRKAQGFSALASLGAAAGNLLTVVLVWLDRRDERRRLLALGDRALRDIGVSRVEAAREGYKPFWRA